MSEKAMIENKTWKFDGIIKKKRDGTVAKEKHTIENEWHNINQLLEHNK